MVMVGRIGFASNAMIATEREALWQPFLVDYFVMMVCLAFANRCLMMFTCTAGMTRRRLVKVVAGEFEMANRSASAEN